ncbi:MAG: hypothetical protein ACHP9V_05900 [Terriglobales bacterium]
MEHPIYTDRKASFESAAFLAQANPEAKYVIARLKVGWQVVRITRCPDSMPPRFPAPVIKRKLDVPRIPTFTFSIQIKRETDKWLCLAEPAFDRHLKLAKCNLLSRIEMDGYSLVTVRRELAIERGWIDGEIITTSAVA